MLKYNIVSAVLPERKRVSKERFTFFDRYTFISHARSNNTRPTDFLTVPIVDGSMVKRVISVFAENHLPIFISGLERKQFFFTFFIALTLSVTLVDSFSGEFVLDHILRYANIVQNTVRCESQRFS